MSQPATDKDRAPGDGFLVLWVAGLGTQEGAIRERLSADGTRVEEIGLDELVLRVNRRAPDLLVLAGTAAEAPDPFVAQLAQTHPGGSVPIVTLGPSESARPRPRSRFGLVARLDREAAAEATHKQIRTLLRGLSRRVPRWKVSSPLDGVPALARRSAVAGRCGLLAAEGGGAIAIDADGVLGPDPARLLTRHEGVETLALTLHERPPGRVRVLRDRPRREETAPGIQGARVLLIDGDLERTRALADQLTAIGAEARAVNLSAQGVHAGRALDPTAIVVSTEALLSNAVTPLWDEPRLASASLLVVEPKAMQGSAGGLVGLLSTLCVPELSLRARLRKREAVAERLESLGAARWLKVLGRCDHEVTLRVYAATGRGRVDLSGGKVRGASFRPTDSRSALIEGRAAVETLLRLPFGRVLAGPPNALSRLEGMRRPRRPSIVGLIAPTPSSGLRRLDANTIEPERPIRAPRLGTLAQPQTLAEAPASDALDVPDEVDEATQSYSAERMAALHKQLEESEPYDDGATDEEDDGADDVTTIAARPITLDAHPTLLDDEEDAVTVAGAPSLALIKRSSGEWKAPPKEEAPAVETASDGPRKKTRNERASPAQRTSSAPGPTVKTAAVAPPASGGLNSGWFVAAVAVVLTIGGALAWFVSREPETPTAPVAEGPRVPNAEPTPAAPVEPTPAAPPPMERQAGPTAPPTVPEPPLEPEPAEPGTDELPTPETPLEGSPAADPGPAAATERPPRRERVERAAPEPTETETEAEAESSGEPADDPAADAPAPSSASSIAELLTESAAAARARDYPRSAALARRVLSGSPRNAPAAYRLGVALFRQRQLEEALTWASRSAEWDARDPLPRSLMGDVYMRTGRFHQAAEAYQEALRLSPRFGPARRQLDRLRERGIVN